MYNDQVAAKLYTYFTTRLGMYEYTRGFIKGDCPICGKKNKFGVNISTNYAHCFSCEHRSGLIKLVQAIENIPVWNEAMVFIGAFEGSGSFRITRQEKRQVDQIELPEGFRLIGLYDSYTHKLVEKNLRKRGFSISRLMSKGIGYCASGKYAGRIIIPYYENGRLIYFNARKFIDLGEKFKNPSEEEVGIGKSQIIYNRDALLIYDKVWLFESATNAITLGNNATATGGKALSPWQKNEYITSPVEKIIIGLDDDGQKEAYKLGMDLASHKKVKVLRFPPKKDANDLGAKATREIEKSTPWMSYQDCYRAYINERQH